MNKDIMPRPSIAIIDSNTLSALGLRQILQNAMPMVDIIAFGSFSELEANNPNHFFHYFVSINIILANRTFFEERKRKTIALTLSTDPNSQLSGFHSLCINIPEKQLIRSLFLLIQQAHANGRNLPPMPKTSSKNILSNREIEVVSLVVQGYKNKEIADKLSIGVTTVISHRKNIMDKLCIKSVSALTIYAVMHGYVDINKI